MASFVPYTLPLAGSHPRLWMNKANGPLLSAIRARWNDSTYASYKQTLSSYAAKRAANPGTYTIDSYYKKVDAEWATALAFAWLMDSSKTVERDRAKEIALHYARNESPVVNATRRQWLRSMAYIYDWLYSEFTSTERADIRSALGNVGGWIDLFRVESDSEYLWGMAHGHINAATEGLLAILEDGNATENTRWRGWMDALMDAHDRGTNSSYFSAFRYFARDRNGKDIGGTHKGSGPFGYWPRNEEFYTRLLPALKSAVAVDWEGTEAWWWRNILWVLWHYRCDGTLHRQNEGGAFARFHIVSQTHALQVANRRLGDPSYYQAAQWFAREVERLDDGTGGAIWGPYHMYNILWRDTALDSSAPTPTRATFGGGDSYFFDNSGTFICRTGWGQADTSLTFTAAKFLTGGHQRRNAGHFELAARGVAFVIANGHYDGNQTVTYKVVQSDGRTLVPGSPNTGHRFTYQQQPLCHSLVRILDQEEPTENQKESFQSGNSSITSIGRRIGTQPVILSNAGPQLWPKLTLNSAPDDLDDLLTTPKWQMDTWPDPPQEDSEKVWGYMDLTPWWWTNKCTVHRRYFIWLKVGTIPNWNDPIVIIRDEVKTPNVDPTFGTRTTIWQIQTNILPTTTSLADFELRRTPGKCRVRLLSPQSLQGKIVTGFFDEDGVEYPPTDTDAFDDSLWPKGAQPRRIERWPSSYDGRVEYLAVFQPAAFDESRQYPAIELVDDADYIGVRFTNAQIDAKFLKSTPGTVFVGPTPGAPPLVEPPTNVVATPGDAQVIVTWTNSTTPSLLRYDIYRRTRLNGTYSAWAIIASPSFSDVTIYYDGAVVNGATYQYKMRAVDTQLRQSADSNTTPDATPTAPPPAPEPPTNLQAAAGDQSVALAWTASISQDVTIYDIYRRTRLNGTYSTYSALTSVSTTTHTDTTVVNGTTYQYIVRARTSDGRFSVFSNSTGDVTPQASPPPPPPPPPPPTAPSTNDARRSSFLSFWQPMPVPRGDVVGKDNRAHVIGLYSGLDYDAPPIDIAVGAGLACDASPTAGSSLSCDDVTTGSGLSCPKTPTAGESLEDCE